MTYSITTYFRRNRMYYVTFSFDDGFKKSSIKTAQIYESLGLRADFNIIAVASIDSSSLVQDMQPNNKWGSDYGDFSLWNKLQDNGHFINPHGYNHTDLASIPFEKAIELINKCIDIFSQHLNHYNPENSIFCFPYNSSNKKIEKWVGDKFRAFRTGYNKFFNAVPNKSTKMIYGDSCQDVEKKVTSLLKEFYKLKNGWFVYNLHGLDGEGWEPVSSAFLKQTLEHLLERKDTKILPKKMVLDDNS